MADEVDKIQQDTLQPDVSPTNVIISNSGLNSDSADDNASKKNPGWIKFEEGEPIKVKLLLL